MDDLQRKIESNSNVYDERNVSKMVDRGRNYYNI